MLCQGIQQLKDKGFVSRFIFLAPPDVSELELRLRRRGSDNEEKIKARLEIANKEIEQSNVDGFHDKIFVNDDLEATYNSLERYIFGDDEDNELPTISISAVGENTDTEMVDDTVPTETEKTTKNLLTAQTEATTELGTGENITRAT